MARGEVDVGFVYATDARIMDDKVQVLMRVATTEPISYPIAVVANSRNRAQAQRFVDFVHSAQAKVIPGDMVSTHPLTFGTSPL